MVAEGPDILIPVTADSRFFLVRMLFLHLEPVCRCGFLPRGVTCQFLDEILISTLPERVFNNHVYDDI